MKKVSVVKTILVIIVIYLFCIKILKMSDGILEIDNKKVPEATKNIEINLCTSWGGTDTKSFALEKIISNFESENPNIKINNRSRGNDNFLFTIKTDFAQGNEPDIFGLWPGSDIVKLIQANKVVDLTEIVNEDEEWKNQFSDVSLSYNIYDNKIYGIPIEIIYEALFINKDIFQKYNIDIPTNYEELKKAIILLRKQNIIPIAFNCTPEGTYLYQNIVMKLGGKENVENPYKDNKINSCYIEGMKYMKELYELGAFPQNAFTLDDRERNRLFLDKEAAMIVQGSWFIGEGAVNGNDKNIDIITFPSFKEGLSKDNAIVYGIGNGNFHLSKKAFEDKEKGEACIKFLKYLTSRKVANEIVTSTGSICDIKGSERIKDQRLVVKGYSLVDNCNEFIGPPDSFIERTFWENNVVKKFPQVLEGIIEPEEVFDEVE